MAARRHGAAGACRHGALLPLHAGLAGGQAGCILWLGGRRCLPGWPSPPCLSARLPCPYAQCPPFLPRRCLLRLPAARTAHLSRKPRYAVPAWALRHAGWSAARARIVAGSLLPRRRLCSPPPLMCGHALPAGTRGNPWISARYWLLTCGPKLHPAAVPRSAGPSCSALLLCPPVGATARRPGAAHQQPCAALLPAYPGCERNANPAMLASWAAQQQVGGQSGSAWGGRGLGRGRRGGQWACPRMRPSTCSNRGQCTGC